jgi:1,4-alpha-glucan branching enzyme
MLKKKFLKTKCKVTFELPSSELPAGIEKTESVHLAGDFNDWNEVSHPMEKSAKGFSITLDLALDREYQFRYLLNGTQWMNDWKADRYVPNPFYGDNSVVSTIRADKNGE